MDEKKRLTGIIDDMIEQIGSALPSSHGEGLVYADTGRQIPRVGDDLDPNDEAPEDEKRMARKHPRMDRAERLRRDRHDDPNRKGGPVMDKNGRYDRGSWPSR